MNSRMVRLTLAAVAAVMILSLLAGVRPAAAQQEYSIWDIQLGMVPENTICLVDSVVVTGVGFYGFCVQEPAVHPTWGRRYSGLWVYTAQNHTFHKGDRVTIRGMYKEYRNGTELDLPAAGDLAFQVKVGTTTIPDPEPVAISEVNSLGLDAEAYENVLVRVDRDDPTIYAGKSEASYPYEWPLHTTPTGGDTLLMYHEAARIGDDFEYDAPDSGTVLSFAQGMLHQYFETYELAPRNCEIDLGGACKPKLRGAYSTSATTINVQYGVDLNETVAETVGNYELGSGASILTAELDATNHRLIHLTTTALPAGDPEQLIVHTMTSAQGLVSAPNESFDFRSGITPIYQIEYVANPSVYERSALENEIVTVEGRATALDGSYYYLQDDDGGAWDGLYVRVARTGPVNVGDRVQATGRVTEYDGGTGTAYTTELGYVAGCDNFKNFGPSGVPVTPVNVTATQIPIRGVAAEPFENCLVKLSTATMLDSLAGVPGPYFGEWRLKQTAFIDTAGVDFNGINATSYDACPGNIITATGILRVYYSTSGFRIAPRTGRGGDIIEIYHIPSCAQTGVDTPLPLSGLALRQNAPNPFSQGTAIGFSLPRDAKVRLDVLDVSGRLVRELVAEGLPAGAHQYEWDGRNTSGESVAAGTYFYRLHVDGTEMSRKMVLLK